MSDATRRPDGPLQLINELFRRVRDLEAQAATLRRRQRPIYTAAEEALAVAMPAANGTLASGTLTMATIGVPAGHDTEIKIRGVVLQNNQPANSIQARANAAATSGPWAWAIGGSAAANGRSTAPFIHRAIIPAGTTSVAWSIEGRFFGGTGATVDIYTWIDVELAPATSAGLPTV